MKKGNPVSRTVPLSAADELKFFKEHLPYRLSMLTSHQTRVAAGDNAISTHRDLAICSYESAQIAGRMFLQFLGLAIDHKPSLHLVEDRTYFGAGRHVVDEVKVIDLNGAWVQLSSLSAKECDLLARFYNAGSKATAHLTSEGSHTFDWRELPQAVELVVRLLKDHLYRPTGKVMDRDGLRPIS